jgi:hypothetical protein
MKVVTLKDAPNAPMEGAERIEGYTGPVFRSRRTSRMEFEITAPHFIHYLSGIGFSEPDPGSLGKSGHC